MIKKIAFGGLGLALLISPAFALAQVDVQSQIAALLAQIKQLQALILQLQGQSSTPATGTASCLDLNNALIIGSTDATTNGEVSKLQRFLISAGYFGGMSTAVVTQPTGYYGTLTAEAVVRFQKANGMDFVTLTSGVGPMTREKLRASCSNSATSEWKKYSDASVEFQYPSLISVQKDNKGTISLSHSVGYKHSNFCDGSGLAPQLDKLTDFWVSIGVSSNNLVDTVRNNGGDYEAGIVKNFSENCYLKFKSGLF